MYNYSLTQWLAFFYVYCVCGWVFESIVVSIQKRRLVNRGFMSGPYIPLYGSGAVLILFVTLPVRDNVVLMFIFGAVAATILEYFTGVIMERLFGVRYWDYSNQKFNFQGQICLSSTLVWGVLTLLLVEIIHPPIEDAVLLIGENVLTNITMAFTVVFTFDFASSFRTAIDMKQALQQVERAKKEMRLMQKRMDVLQAVFNDSVETVAENLEDKINDRKLKLSELTETGMAELSFRMEELRHRIENSENMERVRMLLEQSELDERLEDIQENIGEMRARLEGIRLNMKEKSDSRRIRRMMLRNPSAKSTYFKEEWEYLKDKLQNHEDKE